MTDRPWHVEAAEWIDGYLAGRDRISRGVADAYRLLRAALAEREELRWKARYAEEQRDSLLARVEAAEADAKAEHLARLIAEKTESGRNTLLRARVERLEGALRKYGQHSGHCPAGGKTMARLVEDDDGSRAFYPCTCGLDAALRGDQP